MSIDIKHQKTEYQVELSGSCISIEVKDYGNGTGSILIEQLTFNPEHIDEMIEALTMIKRRFGEPK